MKVKARPHRCIFNPALFVWVVVLSSPLFSQNTTPDTSQASAAPDAREQSLYHPTTDGMGAFSKKLGTNVLLDQKKIWLSPFHMDKKTSRLWVIFGAGTAALIAADHKLSQQQPVGGTFVQSGTRFSRTGQYYSVYPFAGSLYVLGAAIKDEKLAETGALGIQALIDSALVAQALKVTLRRERPLSGDGGGRFEKGGTSFPSGHTIEAWTIATVVARQYHEHRWVAAISYAYATGVTLSRVSSRQHFPSDVVASAAMGFFIGKFVVDNHNLHEDQLKSSPWTRLGLSPYCSAGGLGAHLRWRLGRSD